MCLFRFVCAHVGAVGAVDRPRHLHEVHDHQENAPSEQVIDNDERRQHGLLQTFLCRAGKNGQTEDPPDNHVVILNMY